jgi:hypothetical protein
MRPPKMPRVTMPPILMPAIALALALSILDSGTARAEMVAGGWLMPPRVPKAAPRPPPEVFVPVAPVVRREPPPRPVSRAPARRAPPPSDGKVRF